jgi:glycosyltransferase involved in cell wall biosynthesis
MENKKLKILFLSSWYPNKYRPLLGIFVRRQAEAVGKLCDVSVIYVCPGDKDELVESEENGVYTMLHYYKRAGNAIPFISIFIRLSRFLLTWKKAIKLYEKKKGRPDLIHSNIVIPASGAAKKLKKKWNVPYIISEHWSGYFPQDGRYKGALIQRLTKTVVENASAIITVSEALKKAMQNAGLANNYYVISNIVDTDTFNTPETPVGKGDFTFIHVSSLVEMEKNVTGIIRAFSSVHKDFPGTKLSIVGDGDNKKTLEKLTESLGISGAVNFTGVKPKEELAGLLQQSGAFVLFSNFETQNAALLEALCCGIPGIATTVGGAPEYITPVNGLLVEPKNEKQLEDAMITIIKNRDSYNPLSIRSSVVEIVNEKNVAQKILDVYNSVLKR